VLLSGVSPYRADTVEETKANITYVRYRFEHLYKELTSEATRFLMFLFKRTPWYVIMQNQASSATNKLIKIAASGQQLRSAWSTGGSCPQTTWSRSGRGQSSSATDLR